MGQSFFEVACESPSKNQSLNAKFYRKFHFLCVLFTKLFQKPSSKSVLVKGTQSPKPYYAGEPSKKRCVFSRLLVATTFAFCVILESIEVQTCWAPQNDHLTLSFVEYIYVELHSKKLARNGWKTAIYHFLNSQVQKNVFAICVITFEPV